MDDDQLGKLLPFPEQPERGLPAREPDDTDTERGEFLGGFGAGVTSALEFGDEALEWVREAARELEELLTAGRQRRKDLIAAARAAGEDVTQYLTEDEK